jgi:hypothetical protein
MVETNSLNFAYERSIISKTVVPKAFHYEERKPLSKPLVMTECYELPTQNVANLTENSITTFKLSGSYYIDPSSVILSFTVTNTGDEIALSTDVATGTRNLSKIDGSAASMIKNIIIRSSNGEIIQNIEEYGRIAAILNDIYLSSEARRTNNIAGFGGNDTIDQISTTPTLGEVLTPAIESTKNKFYGIESNGYMARGLMLDSCYETILGHSKSDQAFTPTYTNGKSVVANGTSRSSQRFYIPLYTLFGSTNIEGKMLPILFMGDVFIQITWTKFGCFTCNTLEANNPTDRLCVVNNPYLLYEKTQPDESVNASLLTYIKQNGISIHFTSFEKYEASSTGGTIPSSINIDKKFVSLRTVFVSFTPTVFLTKTNIRAYNRISNNITHLQLDIGKTLIPSTEMPFSNGGNAYGDSNNGYYIYQIQKFLNSIGSYQAAGIINPINFAYNEPQTTGSYDIGCGRAVYVLNCDPLISDNSCISGISTISKNLSLRMKSAAPHTANYNIYCFMYYDASMIIQPDLKIVERH